MLIISSPGTPECAADTGGRHRIYLPIPATQCVEERPELFDGFPQVFHMLEDMQKDIPVSENSFPHIRGPVRVHSGYRSLIWRPGMVPGENLGRSDSALKHPAATLGVCSWHERDDW